MKRPRTWNMVFVVFALGLFLFLTARASNPDRWSGWAFGDAQTMLSLRQWNEGGWLANYLLFVPQGYAKAVKHLDESGLRQHAHGIAPGKGRSVGPRLRYTHYPSGYLIPYATLYRLGFDSLFAARLLSITLSVAALCLAYVLFQVLTTPSVALAAAIIYGLSPVFLSYAYSLANQPLDDFFRFAFLLVVVLATGAQSARKERLLLGLAWGIEFLLSLSSFDSVFFVYAWLIGWDLLNGQGFRWRRYALFALAPLTAHGLQFLQNVWYLGVADAMADISGVFGEVGMPSARLAVTLTSLRKIAAGAQWPVIPWVACAAICGWATRQLPTRHDHRLPPFRLLALLVGCGMVYVLVLPLRAEMPYQGRQFLPAMALLAGVTLATATKSSVLTAKRWSSDIQRHQRVPGWAISSALWGAIFMVTVPFVAADRRTQSFSNPQEVSLAEALSKFPTTAEPVFFSINGFKTVWSDNYFEGRPQIDPILEYYIGSRPILCVTSPEMLAQDLDELLRRSDERFSPILISREPDSLVRSALFLLELKHLSSIPAVRQPDVRLLSGYYVMDLTPAINWN